MWLITDTILNYQRSLDMKILPQEASLHDPQTRRAILHDYPDDRSRAIFRIKNLELETIHHPPVHLQINNTMSSSPLSAFLADLLPATTGSATSRVNVMVDNAVTDKSNPRLQFKREKQRSGSCRWTTESQSQYSLNIPIRSEDNTSENALRIPRRSIDNEDEPRIS
jgi:hypothetical protein